MGIGDEFQEGLTNVQNLIGENPLAATAIAGGVGIAVGAGTTAAIIGAVKKKKKSTKKKSKKSKKKSYSRRKKRKSSRRTPRTAGKGKDRSTKRIRYTKGGQPYVIMRNGRARFIKRSSARRSHKMKGGRY